MTALDYRACAPRAATQDMFLDVAGAPSELGHLAVAVPGSVRGLWDAHSRFGSLPWERRTATARCSRCPLHRRAESRWHSPRIFSPHGASATSRGTARDTCTCSRQDPAGRRSLVVGTPGGATIMTTVFQVISNVFDHGMSLADAVAAPRVHHQHLPDRIQAEPGGLPPEVMDELRAMGHAVVEGPEHTGDVQAIYMDGDGTLRGATDPRRGGVALGL